MEQNYLRLKESFRTKDSHLGNVERNRLIEHGKKIGTDETIEQNERLSEKLKNEVENL